MNSAPPAWARWMVVATHVAMTVVAWWLLRDAAVSYVSYVALGVLAAEAGLLSAWCVWSHFPFGVRFSGWMVGLVAIAGGASGDDELVFVYLTVVGGLSLIAFAFLRWRGCFFDGSPLSNTARTVRFTISQTLQVTGILAVTLGLGRATWQLFWEERITLEEQAGVVAALGLLQTLNGLSAWWLTMALRRRWLGLAMSLATALLLGRGNHLFIWFVFSSPQDWEWELCFGAQCLPIAGTALWLRSHGYRLERRTAYNAEATGSGSESREWE